MGYEEKQRNGLSWKSGLVAILISLLLHQAVFFTLAALGIFDKPEKEQKTEIALIQEPPKPTPPKKPKAKPAPTPQPAPIPKPTPMPKPRQAPLSPPTVEPPPETPAPEPVEEQHPPLPEASIVAAAPEPAPPDPATLKTKMNWGTFERTLGEKANEDLARYQADSMEKRGGAYKFGKISGKVQRALNNRQSWVANAPKEPLEKNASVFRNYLEATHDKIHMLFADTFLPSLVALGANHPLNDFSIMTLVEFEILENGTVNEVHVLKTSGFHVFDAGAVDALYRSSPFSPPPKSILSYNNRVYFRWGFYRNNRKCGTFNAQGYILRGPGAAPEAIPDEKYQIIDG